MTSPSKKLTQFSKMIEKKPTFSRKNDCSSKSSCGHVEWSLTNLPEILRQKTKYFCSMPKSNKENIFRKKFREMLFDTWNAVLTILPKIWNIGGKMAQSPETIKRHIFFAGKKFFNSKIFLRTRIMHFWQHFRKCFAWSRKKFSIYGNEK